MTTPSNELKHPIQSQGHLTPERNQPPSPEEGTPDPEWALEEIHLRDYLEVIVRRKWLIMSFLVLTFLSTLVLTLAQSKRYESFATLEINQAEQNITKFEDLLSETPHWLSERYYETQVSLLTNPALLGRVIDRLELVEHPVIRAVLFESGDLGVFHLIRQ